MNFYIETISSKFSFIRFFFSKSFFFFDFFFQFFSFDFFFSKSFSSRFFFRDFFFSKFSLSRFLFRIFFFEIFFIEIFSSRFFFFEIFFRNFFFRLFFRFSRSRKTTFRNFKNDNVTNSICFIHHVNMKKMYFFNKNAIFENYFWNIVYVHCFDLKTYWKNIWKKQIL